MSAVLHPEGPEEPRTYWLRRGVSLGVVVLLIIVVALIWPKGGDSQTASPKTPPGQTESAPANQAPQPVSPGSVGTSPSPSSPAQPTPTPIKAKPTKAESTNFKPPETGEPASGPQACSAKDLTVSVSGPGSVQAFRPVRLDVSVTNTGKQGCQLAVDQSNFELRVYSGKDKIFSTDHCRKWAPSEAEMLAPGEKVQWKTSWGVNRTAKKCKVAKQRLRPGTYVATAELDKAKPAQLVMRIK